MRSKKFKKKKRTKKEALDIDITSLLDILTILLVFLLKSYNASDLTLSTVKKVTLPKSSTKSLGSLSTLIQVDSDYKVWIDRKVIGRISTRSSETVDFLFIRLKKIKKQDESNMKNLEREVASISTKTLADRKKQTMRRINLVMDQSLPYGIIRKVMHTAASAGYPEFKFIVQGKYN